MARKNRRPRAGDDDFLPRTDAERRAHADALSRAHEGHQCADRADSLCEAGEYYAIVGEVALAEQMFREALDVEEAEPGSVHAAYASFLLDENRHDEALAMIAEARRLHPEDPAVFVTIGEALAECGYHQQAVRWFTAGLVAAIGSLSDLTPEDLQDDLGLALLARGRLRSRQALDLPVDHIDGLAQQAIQADAASEAR
ncbi:MAG: hypothetical protein HOV67_07620 [Kribbellaceae bacterium]|nr:hypothetical protein [Kribbellaceae bacterium]